MPATKTIKFSHVYNKFFDGGGVRRVENGTVVILCLVASVENLDAEFIRRDTAIHGGGEYVLPKGKVIVLWFKTTDSEFSFSTVRRWTPKKEKYYQESIGERFVVEIQEWEERCKG